MFTKGDLFQIQKNRVVVSYHLLKAHGGNTFMMILKAYIQITGNCMELQHGDKLPTEHQQGQIQSGAQVGIILPVGVIMIIWTVG